MEGWVESWILLELVLVPPARVGCAAVLVQLPGLVPELAPVTVRGSPPLPASLRWTVRSAVFWTMALHSMVL